MNINGQFFTAMITAHKEYLEDPPNTYGPHPYGWVYDTVVSVEGGLVKTWELPGDLTIKLMQALTDTTVRALRSSLSAAQSEASRAEADAREVAQ